LDPTLLRLIMLSRSFAYPSAGWRHVVPSFMPRPSASSITKRAWCALPCAPSRSPCTTVSQPLHPYHAATNTVRVLVPGTLVTCVPGRVLAHTHCRPSEGTSRSRRCILSINRWNRVSYSSCPPPLGALPCPARWPLCPALPCGPCALPCPAGPVPCGILLSCESCASSPGVCAAAVQDERVHDFVLSPSAITLLSRTWPSSSASRASPSAASWPTRRAVRHSLHPPLDRLWILRLLPSTAQGCGGQEHG